MHHGRLDDEQWYRIDAIRSGQSELAPFPAPQRFFLGRAAAEERATFLRERPSMFLPDRGPNLNAYEVEIVPVPAGEAEPAIAEYEDALERRRNQPCPICGRPLGLGGRLVRPRQPEDGTHEPCYFVRVCQWDHSHRVRQTDLPSSDATVQPTDPADGPRPPAPDQS